jgi:hypothetical protein
MAERDSSASPYKGLKPYSEQDAPFFFGRETDRRIILSNLMALRLTLLYGASGVGKSSVLRASVVHDVRRLARKKINESGKPGVGIAVFDSWHGDPVKGLVECVRESVAQTPGGNDVTKLRASDGAMLGAFDAGNSPIGIAFDGENIWMANFYKSSVTKLQARDGAILGTYEVEDGPNGVSFAGGHIWVSNHGASTISKIEPRDGTVVGSMAVGRGPSSVIFDGHNIWVASSGSNSVSKVSQKTDSPSTH